MANLIAIQGPPNSGKTHGRSHMRRPDEQFVIMNSRKSPNLAAPPQEAVFGPPGVDYAKAKAKFDEKYPPGPARNRFIANVLKKPADKVRLYAEIHRVRATDDSDAFVVKSPKEAALLLELGTANVFVQLSENSPEKSHGRLAAMARLHRRVWIIKDADQAGTGYAYKFNLESAHLRSLNRVRAITPPTLMALTYGCTDLTDLARRGYTRVARSFIHSLKQSA